MIEPSTSKSETKRRAMDVAEIARECLDESDNDANRASELLWTRAQKKPALFKAIMTPEGLHICREIIASLRRDIRHSVVTNARTAAARGDDGVLALGEWNLMMFPLPIGGKAIADATREDILQNATFYEKQGSDMIRKGRWLSLLGGELREGETVRDALSIERLNALWEQSHE